MATFSAGTRLGAYEIVGPLGAGGMGEVYRARDTKLHREVAIKVLSDLFVADRERIARFEREAHLLAALNHPNIAGIYGFEESGGTHFLILELVDGETLAGRMARGALPVQEAVAIARQIAEALQAAHDKGIIHRDLKPANLALTGEGHVKVLDFGLAKAVGREIASDASNSPTVTLGATQAGVILGTAAYMSPEQAKGRTADKRSDIWSFGCVLYEMLSGRRAFEGEDVSETLANVLKTEPDWRALPAGLPEPIVLLIKRSIEKDRRKRIGDIAAVLFLIDEQAALTSAVASTTNRPVDAPRVAMWQRALPWALTGLAIAGLAVVLAAWSPWRPASPPVPLHLSVELGVDGSLWSSNSGAAAILSPDGTTVAFVAQESGGSPQLFVRRLDRLQAIPLPGARDATSPFFSRDGQWIAFFAEGQLKKIAITGGTPIKICDVPDGRGGDWGDDGTIVYSPSPNQGTHLWRVSAAGGTPAPLTTLDEGQVTQRFPQVLPGSRAVLFMQHSSTGGYEDAHLVVQTLPDGPRKVVIRGGYYPRYASSGHLLYVHEGTLFAAPFELKNLEVTGTAVPVVEGVASGPGGGAQVAVAASGVMVYLRGQTTVSQKPMVWLNRDGTTSPLRSTPSNWSAVAFAPDGRRLALDINDGKGTSVWVYEWERNTLSHLTTGAETCLRPVWTPDGRRIVSACLFRGAQGSWGLTLQSADGSGEVTRLTESPIAQFPASWHPNGKSLAFTEGPTAGTGWDIRIMPIEGDDASGWKAGKPTAFANGPALEQNPAFSPDGKWIAYESNETGPPEVYVRPLSGPGKWQISAGGGSQATWSRSRSELLFATIAPSYRFMVVPYSTPGGSFLAEKARLWAEARFATRTRPTPTRFYDLHGDGNRLAFAPSTETSDARQDKVVLVLNFFAELRRLAPGR